MGSGAVDIRAISGVRPVFAAGRGRVVDRAVVGKALYVGTYRGFRSLRLRPVLFSNILIILPSLYQGVEQSPVVLALALAVN